MKSAETETGHVADVIARMAVSRPDVAFSCTSDERELLRLQRSDLQRRLAQVVGRESSQHLYPVKGGDEYATITGFISGPALVRSGTQAIYTYINGRFIRDKVVQHAVMQAYRGVIDRGRYPVVALFIELPPGEVDVNVHPTKHEVRFRRQSVVHDAIQGAVEEVLRSSPWLAARSRHVHAPPSGATGQSVSGADRGSGPSLTGTAVTSAVPVTAGRTGRHAVCSSLLHRRNRIQPSVNQPPHFCRISLTPNRQAIFPRSPLSGSFTANIFCVSQIPNW